MKLTKYSDLPPDGFAGVRMREIVKDVRLFGQFGGAPHAAGIGNLVYLADAHFIPYGDTRMHPHIEIDIVTLVVKGRIAHQGSLGHGTTFHAYDAQIQRAGGRQILHNEINPDDDLNHVIQLWFLPEKNGLEPEYQVIPATQGHVTRVYGGAPDTGVLAARTLVDVVRLQAGQRHACEGLTQVYVAEGRGRIEASDYEAGDLFTIQNPHCHARGETTLIVMRDSGIPFSATHKTIKDRESISQP